MHSQLPFTSGGRLSHRQPQDALFYGDRDLIIVEASLSHSDKKHSLGQPQDALFYGDRDLIIVEASLSHSDKKHSLGLFSRRVTSPTQRPLSENTQHSQETDIHHPAGFEPAITACEQPQNHALDRAATGNGM